MRKYIGLEAPTVLGMGAVGPTLALLTATLCSAFGGLIPDSSWLYPVIMLFLSGAMAVFPTAKAEYSKLLKVALWPVLTAVIFASAWTSSTGMSAGEEALGGLSFSMTNKATAERPHNVSMAPDTSFMTEEDTNRVVNTFTNMQLRVLALPAYNSSEKENALRGRFFKRMR